MFNKNKTIINMSLARGDDILRFRGQILLDLCQFSMKTQPFFFVKRGSRTRARELTLRQC